jgi:hypothetical protein
VIAPETLPIASAPARELAGRVDADAMAAGVSAEILARCYAEHADDAGFVDSLDRSVRDNVRAIVGLLAGRVEIESVNPADALAFADLSASLDIPAAMLPRAYQVGVGDLWRQWFDRCRIEAPALDVALEELVREPTILMFAYIDFILEAVVGQYDQTRAEMVRTREHLRRTVLAQILDGSADTSDPIELERALAYPLRATHVAVSLEATDRAVISARAAALRTATDAADTLIHQSGARRWTIWLARHDGFGDRLCAISEALADVRAAVSEPWDGVEGLRRSAEEAEMAAGVQLALRNAADPVVLYRDVRLDALLLADPARARRFLREELGPLAGTDPRLSLIREALLVWLSTGSHVSAAATLGVHENTVRNRVRQAEDLLPGGVTMGRRTELQVALRLQRVLG